MLIPEDEHLEHPAHCDRADAADDHQPPLERCQPRRPRPARDEAGAQAAHPQDGAREHGRTQRIQTDRIGDVALPHVGEGACAAAEGAGMPGQVVKRARRQHEVRGVDGPVDAGIDEPQGQAAEDAEVAETLISLGLRDRDGEGHADRSRPTMSSVVSATATPAALNASSLLFAVPRLPEMIAPAWPIRLPSGAVRPDMNATVFNLLPLARSSAARSSSLPPISPLTTRWVVWGSFSKSSMTSLKVRPSMGSPPIPTIVDWPMPAAVSAEPTS